MSGYREFFLHLGATPKTREQLEAETGLNAKTVSNRLTQCKVNGLAKRTKEGWVAMGINTTDEGAALPPQASKRGKKRGAKRGTKRASKRGAKRATKRRAPIDEATMDFFVDHDGDVQLVHRDGQVDALIVPRADAVRLAEFLQRARPMLEAP